MGDLGDRMKMYERIETGKQLVPLLPIVARIDGRAFHTLTRHMEKPFDYDFMSCMQDTTRWLVEETSALIGYTQSDEINLLFYSDNLKSQIFFDGKPYKMISVLASMATWKFQQALQSYLHSGLGRQAFFDCRVFMLPNRMEAVNVFVWREFDAVRNSILMLGQAHYSHKQMHGKKTNEVQDMLHVKGINWNAYPNDVKRGKYFQRKTNWVELTKEERERIPEKHRPPNGQLVARKRVLHLDLPPITTIENRVKVFFEGEEPKTNGG